MFCIQCGNEIQPEMKFCPSCGSINIEVVPQKSENSTETPCRRENNDCCASEISKFPVQTNFCPVQNQISSGLSVTGFVCGLLAFCFALLFLMIEIFYRLFFLGFFEFSLQAALIIVQTLSVMGFGFSGVGLAMNQGKGKSIAGLVLSILAIIILLTLSAMSIHLL